MKSTSIVAASDDAKHQAAELRRRATIGEDEFVRRMHAVRQAEADTGSLDASDLMDRLAQALSTPYTTGTDGWTDLIEGFAADLFRDDRWNGVEL